MKGKRGLPTVQAGFIKTILIIVIALVALGFFGYNLREITSSPAVRDNLIFVSELLVKIWHNFILTPILWLWEKVAALRS